MVKRQKGKHMYDDEDENRWPPGWWILPMALIGCFMWYLLIKWIVGLL